MSPLGNAPLNSAKGHPLDRKKLRACVRALQAFFPDVPEGFEHEGQTFDQRCEAWIRHAIEQLESEIEAK